MKTLVAFLLPTTFALIHAESSLYSSLKTTKILINSIKVIFDITTSTAGLVPRIIDGIVAKPGEIPYQVALQDIGSGLHFCGGSILSDYYVITAAHCVDGKSPKNIKVIAGTVDLLKKGSEHYAKEIYMHTKYNSSDSWVNDIALIKVDTRFVKSALISFVPLPEPGEVVKANDPAIVSGFGRLAYQGERTNLLHWVNITIANQDYCREVYSQTKNIYGTHVCAYDPTAVRGHCKGDSGGPLMVRGKLAGLVSWSKNCADKVYPSVYTRVSSYLDWIKEHAI
ncbi:chymotrypsin-2-like [Calliopsis andreniformis]|uniref:chymotrypsin-2-like n=1 Tax=Calliopsis andreniformis TaxID=337506 RepID=UPI003FCE40EA